MLNELRLYRPFGVVGSVAVSFSLLGILEEGRLLSLLSLWRLIAEVGGGFYVVLVVVIYPRATTCCRVDPPISRAVVCLLLCFKDVADSVSE